MHSLKLYFLKIIAVTYNCQVNVKVCSNLQGVSISWISTRGCQSRSWSHSNNPSNKESFQFWGQSVTWQYGYNSMIVTQTSSKNKKHWLQILFLIHDLVFLVCDLLLWDLSFSTAVYFYKEPPCHVVVAEWLRRWTRNPLGSPRAGSNPADYVVVNWVSSWRLYILTNPGVASPKTKHEF